MSETYSDHDRLVRLETQVDRIISDIDSEKGTRLRSNVDFRHELETIRDNQAKYAAENRSEQQKTNRIVWMGLGFVALLETLLPVYLAVKK